jgi:hypothetical protein
MPDEPKTLFYAATIWAEFQKWPKKINTNNPSTAEWWVVKPSLPRREAILVLADDIDGAIDGYAEHDPQEVMTWDARPATAEEAILGKLYLGNLYQ